MRVLDTSIKSLIEATQYLNNDYLIVFPTDTVYGLGAKISSITAIQDIYKLKKRKKNKLLPIFVSSIELLFNIVDDAAINSICLESLISKFWPGPLTIVLKKSKYFKHPFYIDSDYIAVRNPNHFVPKVFMDHIKEPLVCSSANVSGFPPLTNIHSIENVFSPDVLKVVIDGGELVNKEVSTLVKLFPNFEILREGKIKKEELLDFF